MKKKPWGRLGAAISAVALLAGGLVGVAGPASAVGVTDVLAENEEYCDAPFASTPGRYSKEKSQEELADYCLDSALGLVAPFRNAKYAQSWGQAYAAVGTIPSQGPSEQDCIDNGQVLNQDGVCEAPPPQHEDRVCAYVVSKFVSSAGAAAKECQGLLSNPRDLDKVTESQSAAPNGKYLFTATVSTQYLAAGLDFTPPAEPSDWNQCAEGLFPTGSGCEEHIPVDWPESQECPDGQVLTAEGCEEEILVGEPEWQECPDGQVLTAEGCKEEILVGEPDDSIGSWSDPPTGTTWTGNFVCGDTKPSSGDWVRAYVPDCSKTRALADNAWAEYAANEPVQKAPPPPPCWDASINNCPVAGALRFVAPRYAMVGVPVTMYAYASWRPDANAPSQPTNGTAVIRVDGEDYSGVEFKDGVAEWRFIPETEGMKEFTASGVVFSGLSGANAYIDTVPARTYVLEYDPEAYAYIVTGTPTIAYLGAANLNAPPTGQLLIAESQHGGGGGGNWTGSFDELPLETSSPTRISSLHPSAVTT